MFLQSQLPAGNSRLEVIYDHLRANLQDIVNAGLGAGAQVLISTVPVNLKDSAPFGSLHDPELTTEQLAAWDRLYQDGVRLEAAGDFLEAIGHFQEAAKIDDRYADLAFRLGRCLSATGQHEQAKQEYARARDLDTLRFRADTRINDTIRLVARARSMDGVHLVDGERVFANNSSGQAPGEDLFYEHVHMNFSGNYLLARSLFEIITELLPASVKARTTTLTQPLSEEQCAERLAFTDWNRFKTATSIQAMLQQPPFINQLDCAARARRWQEKLTDLRRQLQPAALRQANALYRQAIQAAGGDWMLRMNFGQLLTEGGDLTNAAEQYEAVLKSYPHLFSAHVKLGDLHLQAGKPEDAITHFRAAVTINPDFAEAHYGLARALAAAGKIDDALAIYAERLKQDPDRAGTLEKMAVFLASVGRAGEARQRLAAALQIDPDSASAHAHLGSLLLEQGAIEEAKTHLERALQLRPGWPEIENRLAELQQAQKKEGTNKK